MAMRIKRSFQVRICNKPNWNLKENSIKPLRIYRFNEGLTRFSTNNYNSDKNDRCAHLTNYAVNKNNKNYIQNKQPFDIDYNSSKWTLTSFRQYLEEHNINSDLLFDKIDDIIIKTLISCENNLLSAISKYCAYQENCFELYGFDILLDENLNCSFQILKPANKIEDVKEMNQGNTRNLTPPKKANNS